MSKQNSWRSIIYIINYIWYITSYPTVHIIKGYHVPYICVIQAWFVPYFFFSNNMKIYNSVIFLCDPIDKRFVIRIGIVASVYSRFGLTQTTIKMETGDKMYCFGSCQGSNGETNTSLPNRLNHWHLCHIDNNQHAIVIELYDGQCPPFEWGARLLDTLNADNFRPHSCITFGQNRHTSECDTVWGLSSFHNSIYEPKLRQ